MSLARTILKNPKILFLDEATSALDTHTEQSLLASFRTLLRETGMTSLHIAHRLRTIADAGKLPILVAWHFTRTHSPGNLVDTIFVLKDGKIAESGSHEQLVNKPKGVYKGMWERQENTDAYL